MKDFDKVYGSFVNVTATVMGLVDSTQGAVNTRSDSYVQGAAKIGSATSSYTTGATRLFVVDNGTESRIFRFRSSSANASVSSSELTLVAVARHASGTTGTDKTDFRFGA